MKLHTSRSVFRLKSVAAAASLVLLGQAAWAADPFVIQDIQVEGLQRVDAGTVFSTIPVKVGDTYDDERGAAAIRSLFALGLFQDVRIDVRGNQMVIVVQERQTINTVDINASREFDKKALLAGLANMGIESGRPYNKGMEDRAIQELKRQYQTKGFYNTEITPTITPVERNRVNVLFTIRDGEKAKVRDINFVGNQAFSDATLRDEMQLDTGSWLSWYTKSDIYSDNKLNTDLDAIRSFYHNRGYMEFRVDSVQVALAPDGRNMAVTVNVTEGPRYVVSAVSMQGNYLDKNEEFQSLINIKPGQPYKIDDVTETIDKIKKRFGSYGYAFAQVAAKPIIQTDKQQVELALVAEPGQRAYIRRINVAGNTKTRDEVVRREMRQYEASWFDAEKIKLSKERLDRLGYFNDVQIETKPIEGRPDQADLDVTVVERPTGSVQLGAGYSSSDKLSFSFNLSQENIFGSGQSAALEINTSKFNRVLSLSSTDPYFTTSGISRTFYASHTRKQPWDTQGSRRSYVIQSEAAGVSFGVPFSENNTVNFGIGIERYGIKRGEEALLPSYQNYIDYYGKNAIGVPLSIGWSRDTRDSSLVPTSGYMHRINGILSPAGKMRYAMATYKYQHYFPLGKSFAFMFNLDAGYGKGLSCRTDAASGIKENCFPFYKNFYMGGIGSVRGFDEGGIGPQELDPVTGNYYAVGGTRMFNTNIEFIAPFPGANNDKTLRLFAFIDAGNVYADKSRTYTPTKEDRQVRVSAGVGLRWISPLGPLSLSFGQPLRKQPGDKLQRFQFQMGTTF
ncbi:MAG: outer membrane protein assembly factor BamA [Brachymonas sp.]|nr:outer membrane protein assembly factor BamA [Brachymonas sp.]